MWNKIKENILTYENIEFPFPVLHISMTRVSFFSQGNFTLLSLKEFVDCRRLQYMWLMQFIDSYRRPTKPSDNTLFVQARWQLKSLINVNQTITDFLGWDHHDTELLSAIVRSYTICASSQLVRWFVCCQSTSFFFCLNNFQLIFSCPLQPANVSFTATPTFSLSMSVDVYRFFFRFFHFSFHYDWQVWMISFVS